MINLAMSDNIKQMRTAIGFLQLVGFQLGVSIKSSKSWDLVHPTLNNLKKNSESPSSLLLTVEFLFKDRN